MLTTSILKSVKQGLERLHNYPELQFHHPCSVEHHIASPQPHPRGLKAPQNGRVMIIELLEGDQFCSFLR